MTEEESQESSEDTSEDTSADTSEESTETIHTQQSFAAEKAIKADTPKGSRPSTPDPEDEES